MDKSINSRRLSALLLALCLLAGCGSSKPQAQGTTAEAPAQAAPAEPPAQTESAAAEQANTAAVADASQMTAVEAVGTEGMAPVCAEELKDGAYPVAVDSSSSMFKIESCELIVDGGAMTAELTMSSDAYGYLFPGRAEEAAAADASQYVTPEERTFALAIDALDAPVSCAAWSRNKELWYDRTLVFRADSLPLDAFETLTTAESLGLADGAYAVAVTLGGGSGKAKVASPCALRVEGGAATAEIVWGSANYDYMRLGDEMFLPVNTEGNSTFVIPVAVFDRAFSVIADTTAMSQPHEIEYTLRFDSESIAAAP